MKMNVFCDNLNAVLLAAKYPILHCGTKHFKLYLYFVRENVQQKQIEVHHIPSAEQTVDVLTKPVTNSNFDTTEFVVRVN